jgi:hypothetical protein
LLGGLNLRLRNAHNVRSAAPQHFNLFRVNIKPGNAEILLAKKQYQRQPNVAQANHANARCTVFQLGGQRVSGLRVKPCRYVFQCAHNALDKGILAAKFSCLRACRLSR